MKAILFVVSIVLFSSCSTEKVPNGNVSRTSRFAHVLTGNLDTMGHTDFHISVDEKIEGGKNQVYCVSMAMAFEKFEDQLGRYSISDFKSFFKSLGNDKYVKDVLEDEAYFSHAGFGQTAVSAINDGLQRKFPGMDYSNADATDLDLIAYAYLEKNLPFNVAFESSEDRLKFNGIPVSCFGLWWAHGEQWSRISSQFKLVYYKSDDEFIVELYPKDKDHIIVLSKIPSKKTFWNTFEKSEKLISKNRENTELYPFSHLEIPKMGFNLTKNFAEYFGIEFSNNDKTYTLESMMQKTLFLLDEKGAILKSESEMLATEEAMEEEQPKELEFDKPFFLYVVRKERKAPYFMMWVDNTAFMQKRSPSV